MTLFIEVLPRSLTLIRLTLAIPPGNLHSLGIACCPGDTGMTTIRANVDGVGDTARVWVVPPIANPYP
jgi:hypothetical protein